MREEEVQRTSHQHRNTEETSTDNNIYPPTENHLPIRDNTDPSSHHTHLERNNPTPTTLNPPRNPSTFSPIIHLTSNWEIETHTRHPTTIFEPIPPNPITINICIQTCGLSRQLLNNSRVAQEFRELIDQITYPVEPQDTYDTCPICIRDYNLRKPPVRTSCNHNFHRLCLKTWIESRKTCPMCRTPLR